MIALDAPPRPEIPKPAIIRPAEHSLLRPGAFRPCSPAERQAVIANLVRTGRLGCEEAKQAMYFVPVVGWQAGGPISISLDSSFDTGGSSGTHNCGTRTSSGPDTILVVTSRDSNASHGSLISGTWNENSITILEKCDYDVTHVAIAHIDGPQNGTLILDFQTDADHAYVSILSLANLKSNEPIDTQSSSLPNGASETVSLASLGSPGVGGIRVVGGLGSDNSLALDTWINATGLVEAATGNYRHFVAYDLGDDDGTITMDIGHTGGHKLLAGVALR